MRLEMEAWVLNSFSAVRRKLFRRATQTKVSRNFRFMAVSGEQGAKCCEGGKIQ
ncbi:hypothetical protein D3C72_2187570 [compost metagenome]